MNILKSKNYQEKLTAILGVVIGITVATASYFHYDSAQTYKPLPQQVFVNMYNQPIGVQNLLQDTDHNMQYRINGTEKEGASDFLKDALINIFTYNKDDLESGVILDEFLKWCSEDEGRALYLDSFVNLGQQRVVMAQDGFVRSRVVGDFKYIGSAQKVYESTSGISRPALTHKFEGTMIITAHGEKEYPTVYSVTAQVQRALLQDKIKGYQCIELELR